MDKRSLTERDICTKFILPALKRAGWDEMLQVREEVYFTKGRIIVRGKAKKADFVLYYKPNVPIALIEAKDNNHAPFDLSVSGGTVLVPTPSTMQKSGRYFTSSASCRISAVPDRGDPRHVRLRSRTPVVAYSGLGRRGLPA